MVLSSNVSSSWTTLQATDRDLNATAKIKNEKIVLFENYVKEKGFTYTNKRGWGLYVYTPLKIIFLIILATTNQQLTVI